MYVYGSEHYGTSTASAMTGRRFMRLMITRILYILLLLCVLRETIYLRRRGCACWGENFEGCDKICTASDNWPVCIYLELGYRSLYIRRSTYSHIHNVFEIFRRKR